MKIELIFEFNGKLSERDKYKMECFFNGLDYSPLLDNLTKELKAKPRVYLNEE